MHVLCIIICLLYQFRTIYCEENYNVIFQWSYMNFTWPDAAAYENAVATKAYIKEHCMFTGIKYRKNKYYVSLPRFPEGTPATLAALDASQKNTLNPLLSPYPNWEANSLEGSCETSLKNVQSMEIDTKGIMWVLDGTRGSPLTECPPKIVLLDLNKGGTIIQSYTMPQELGPWKYAFLNDIVIDETEDDCFGYISDSSNVDPGIIVFSRNQNRAWKFRDASMFAELEATDFTVKDVTFTGLMNVDGIALSPPNSQGEKTMYYVALVGFDIYSLSNTILKNESVLSDSMWREQIQKVLTMTDRSDGMVCDNKGTLYYGAGIKNSVMEWCPKHKESSVVIHNDNDIIWPDTFAFDDYGNLLVSTNHVFKYSPFRQKDFPFLDDVKFRIISIPVKDKSYLYPE